MQTSITSWLQKKPESTIRQEKLADHQAPDDEDAGAERLQVASSVDEFQLFPLSQPSETADIRPSFAYKHRPLPSKARISRVTSELLPQFKRLITVLLPVPYSNTFYSEILNDSVAASLSLVVIWREDFVSDSSGRVISGIRCRLLAQSPSTVSRDEKSSLSTPVNVSQDDARLGPSLYIATMATYSPYRGHGLASTMLRRLIKSAAKEHDIKTITAHVWEASPESREWYTNRGFKEVRYEPEYHKRLNPRGAYLVERRVLVSDLLGEEEEI